MQPYRQQRNTGRRTWQVLLVLLAVLAAGVQQVVAQSHWHNPAVASQVGSGSPDDDTGKHDDCLWCQIAAHASAAAPPVSLEVLVVPDVFAVRASSAHHFPPVLRPAHAWQSRGPPSL